MFKWIPFPFLRYLLVFAGGIIAGINTNQGIYWIIFPALALVYGMIIWWPGTSRGNWKGILGGITGLTTLFLAGIIHVHNFDEAKGQFHYGNKEQPPPYYQARVLEPSENTGKYYKTLVEINSGLWRDTVMEQSNQSLTGKVLLYHPVDGPLKSLSYGDQVVVRGQPQPVEGPSNPGVFNYKQFLAYRNIFHQHFVDKGEVALIGRSHDFNLIGLAYSLRSKCRDILSQHIKDPEALSIALALTLGIKSTMDPSLENAFAAAGAMHILAVSGLHVGIIYGIIYLLFFPLKKLGRGRWLHGGICILLLWGYALITGLSPSVLRAVTMFSFVMVGQMTGRQQGIFNTIALSAFILLCFNPYFLMHVGFQLSYMAVFGIVLLFPYIKNWVQISNSLGDKIWQITAVSIAAQIATFPLALYYFHQFPVYFLITNLLVIPAASVILSLGLVTLFMGFVFPWLASWTGWFLEQGIRGLIEVIYFQEGLPMNTLSNLEITFWQVLLLYILVAMLLLLFVSRKLKWLILGFVCLSLIMSKEVYDIYRVKNHQKMVIYDIPGRSVAGIFAGKNYQLLTENLDESAFAFNIQPSLVQWGIETKKEKFFFEQSQSGSFRVFDWQGKRFIFIKEKLPYRFKLEDPLVCNYLIISNNAVENFKVIKENFKPDQLIIDSSNKYYRARDLSKQANDFGISCHNVLVNGAFMVPLEM